MKIVGLCGGSGSGKSTAAEMFRAYGLPVVDADALYHELTDAPSDCVRQIAEAFGDEVVTPTGALNRPVLAKRIFSDPTGEARKKLNRITHGQVLALAKSRMSRYEEEGARVVIFDVPLLFESGFDRMCDRTVCVVADPQLRLRRIMSRDGVDETMARARMAAQIPDEELMRRCDLCIRNDGTTEELAQAVKECLSHILA